MNDLRTKIITALADSFDRDSGKEMFGLEESEVPQAEAVMREIGGHLRRLIAGPFMVGAFAVKRSGVHPHEVGFLVDTPFDGVCITCGFHWRGNMDFIRKEAKAHETTCRKQCPDCRGTGMSQVGVDYTGDAKPLYMACTTCTGNVVPAWALAVASVEAAIERKISLVSERFKVEERKP